MLTPPEYEMLISSISHELRNPLTLISSYLQLMELAHPEVSEYAQWHPIQNELRYLNRLLGDISTLHQTGPLSLVPTDSMTWLTGYLESAKRLVQSLGNADTHFTFWMSEQLPTLPLDTLKLRQVLDNLIRNSIEATDGPNTITLSASTLMQNLIIQVSDTGCGLPETDISSLFHPYVSHKPKGSGLGLAISKRIVEAHGGDLTVCSVPGQGAVFTILLPTQID